MRMVVEVLVVPSQPEPGLVVAAPRRRLKVAKGGARIMPDEVGERAARGEGRPHRYRLGDVHRHLALRRVM